MNDSKLDFKNVGMDFSNEKSTYSINENDNEIVITILKKKNYTIQDLKQKIINSLYNEKPGWLGRGEIELLDVILRNGY